MTIETTWRGAFTNEEANLLHAEAFETRAFDASEWNWDASSKRTAWAGSRPGPPTS